MAWKTFRCQVALHKVVWTSYDAFIDTDYDRIQQDVSHVFCPTVAKITHSLIARVILHMTCMQPVQYVVGYLLSGPMSKEEIVQHLYCRCHHTCKPQRAPPYPPSANMLHIGRGIRGAKLTVNSTEHSVTVWDQAKCCLKFASKEEKKMPPWHPVFAFFF